MKTIYVTVAEFLREGGDITNKQLYWGASNSTPVDILEDLDEYNYLITDGNLDGTASKSDLYVQITCTPHYV